MVTLPDANTEFAYVNDVFTNSESQGALLNPLNYAAAAVDAVATIPNLVLPDSLEYDSVIPESFTGYHKRKGAFDAMTGIATVFTGIGLGTKAAQIGGFAERAMAGAGVGAKTRSALFADRASLAQYDDMMATAMGARANAIASTGRTTPNVSLTGRLDDGAAPVRTLTGADTYEGAAQWASRLSVRNGLKEAVWQEAAIFALGSQNEFLFPEDAGFASLLGFAAGGAALGVGIETVLRRTALRKTAARTAQAAGSLATQTAAERGLLTENYALGSKVGEQWQNQAAAIYATRALDELETNVDAIVSQGNGALSREAVLNEIGVMRSAYKRSGEASAMSQLKNRIDNKVVRDGFEGAPGVSREYGNKAISMAAYERMAKNDKLVGPLAELGDKDYIKRYAEINLRVEDAVSAADKARRAASSTGDSMLEVGAEADFEAALAVRRQLDEVRPATIEPYAVANYSMNRATPFWETSGAAANRVARNDIAILENSSVGINVFGKPIRMEGKNVPRAASMEEMAFDDVTAMYTTIGRMVDDTKGGVDNSWSKDFWRNYMNDPNQRWDDLPFPLQDAIVSGAIKLPTDFRGMPRYQELDAAVKSGMIANSSLAQKLDWWKQGRDMVPFGAGRLDLMDAEKALNLRLTDNAGNPNILGRAVMTFADAKSDVSAKTFLLNREGNAEAGLRHVFDLGHGASQASHLGLAEALLPDFQAGLKGIDAFNLHKPQNHGIGALYHRVDTPTDGEMALAKLASLRNADRLTQLVESKSELVSSVSQALTEVQQVHDLTSMVESLFNDIRVKGNTLQQVTNQHRFQKALQAAAMTEKAGRTAHDAAVKRVLEPLAANVRNAMKSQNWSKMAPEIANTQQLVSRGVALVGESYVSGVNKIDLSRPGAKQLVDALGNLEGAPAKLEDWLMFDISVAANQGRYVPVQLSDEGAWLLNQYADASHEVYKAINALRKSAGMPAMERLNGHMPTMNFARYKLRYIEDTETGRVIGYVKGKTDAEVEASLQARLVEENGRREVARTKGENGGSPVRAISLDEIKEHYDAIDEVFLHNLRDFSGVKQGGTASGKNLDYRLDVSTDLAEDMMIALRNSFDDVRRRTTAAVFAPQLNGLQNAMRKAGPQGEGSAQKGFFSALEQYQNVLLGDNRLPDGSNAKMLHAGATQLANWAMGAFANTTPYVWRALQRDLNGFATPAEAKFAEEIRKNYNPLGGILNDKDLASHLKLGTDVDPYRAEKALQLMNRGVASALLKIANVAHPILNYAGVLVTSPAVLNAMRKMPNESLADWKTRVGPMADMTDDDAGLATVSAHKLLSEGFHAMLNRVDVLEEAQRRGMIEANMLEELNRLNNLRPSKFVDSVEKAAKYGDFINVWLTPLQKKITGKEPSAFTLSERSETGSRAWVHMMGYVLAEKGGVKGEAAKHVFAHTFANQNIADYSPHLRGQAFRGMAGIPFGLFQSYAVNVYQRLFNYVGDGNKRALMVQMASQASMFGVSGLPGWDVLNSYYFPQKDVNAGLEGASLNERIYNGFGKDVADILMQGTLSNLPKLVGGDAINLFTSGDMNLRMGFVPPAFSVMGQTAQMTKELIRTTGEEFGKLGGPESFDGDRIMEVVANYAPMRGYRSMADLFIGERVDRNGNLILEDTRSGSALLSRMLGTKTVDELRLGEAIFTNSQAMAQRRQDHDRLRSQMLRTIREGGMTEDELASYAATYLAKGGRSDQWDKFVDYTTEKAGLTREERVLETIVGKAGEIYKHQFTSARRLENAGVQPTEEMLARKPQQ